MRDSSERLQDVLEAIDRIGWYASRGREVCATDELIQVWLVYHLQIIEQALHGLTETIRDQHPELWQTQALSRRDLLFSSYDIDMDAMWQAVEHDLPALRAKIEPILYDLGGKP